MTVANWLEI